MKRALDSVTAGTGDEVVPTGMASEIWRDVHLSTVISSFLPRINMPTNPFDIPLDLGDVTFYKATENATGTATDLSTNKSTLSAGGVKAMTAWSYELDEDAVLAMLPAVREVFARNTAETIETAAAGRTRRRRTRSWPTGRRCRRAAATCTAGATACSTCR